MFRKIGIRLTMLGLLAAAFFAAPSAMARSSWSVSIGGPGFGIGYSDYGHRHGWGGNYGYAYGGYGYGYPGGYYPAYYAAPVYYYGGYYPSYYPGYSTVVYYDRPVRRGYYRNSYRGYRHHDGYRNDYGHRSSYYDRSGYYRHD
jgi:hypothetical protein